MQTIKSHARIAVTIEFTPTAGSAITMDTNEQTKIMIPNTLHFTLRSPNKPEIPAESISRPTTADAIAAMSNANTALIAEIGDQIPQMMYTMLIMILNTVFVPFFIESCFLS